MAKQDTKENLLRVGVDIIHRKGYHHTAIQEILQIAGVPKGSFYFYFKSKEDFGLQVIDYFNEIYAAQAKEILERTSSVDIITLLVCDNVDQGRDLS